MCLNQTLHTWEGAGAGAGGGGPVDKDEAGEGPCFVR